MANNLAGCARGIPRSNRQAESVFSRYFSIAGSCGIRETRFHGNSDRRRGGGVVGCVHATWVLGELGEGSPSAENDLLPLVYDELRALAARHMAGERVNHTLQPTALAHEAYLRLIDQEKVGWENRAHFLALAARMVRRILVDHAREKRAAKRGEGRAGLALTDVLGVGVSGEVDFTALDEALEVLRQLNERHHRAIELRFFGGLTIEETAHVLGVSPQTVRADWRMARAWLGQRLRDQN